MASVWGKDTTPPPPSPFDNLQLVINLTLIILVFPTGATGDTGVVDPVTHFLSAAAGRGGGRGGRGVASASQ